MFVRLLNAYKNLFSRIGDKVVAVHHADVENIRLRQENAELRLQIETREFDSQAKLAEIRSQEFGSKLEGETGLAIGRTLASIQYDIPSQVQPLHLHTLAVTYFKAGEDEKAAKILHYLLGIQSGEFRTPKNLLMAGILWYRLDNAQIADSIFSELVRRKTSEVAPSIQSQAILWRALIARKQGKPRDEQETLRELLSQHPHSREARWVNETKEAGRVPAKEH